MKARFVFGIALKPGDGLEQLVAQTSGERSQHSTENRDISDWHGRKDAPRTGYWQARLWGGALETRTHIAIRMHFFADEAQLAFQISARGFKGVGIDCQRRAEHHERSAEFRRPHGLLHG